MEKYNSILEQTILLAKEKIESPDFKDIFSQTPKIYKVENNYIYIILPDPLSKFRVEKFYLSQLNSILEQTSGEKINFKLVTQDVVDKEEKESNIKITTVDEAPKQTHTYFRHEYTFENFMVGESNRFAFLSAMKVAENPHGYSNPLYIFGDVGLGKTHLMTAIGQYVLDKNINTNIVYVNTTLFIEEYFLATSSKSSSQTITSFYNKYRNADILLVDDIQFLNNKKATQEEFFKIFEYLHSNNKQIIVTSDRPSSELENIMPRLKSRFDWGLSVDIKAPDKKLRLSILKSKLSFLIKDINDVPDEILELISDCFQNNIRELEGALRRVINYCVALNMPFTLENAQTALDGILPKNRKNNKVESDEVLIIKNVKDAVCSYFAPLSLSDLESNSRKQNITYPRQLAMYILKNTFKLQLNVIGEAFGGRDHATVGHGIDKITNMIKTDNLVKRDLENLQEKLKKNK